MTERKISPGPWEFVPADGHHGGYVKDANGRAVCDSSDATPTNTSHRWPMPTKRMEAGMSENIVGDLPEFNRLVVAKLDGTKEHSGHCWRREGWAFMVRWDVLKYTVADGWARDRYERALADMDADFATVDAWFYPSDALTAANEITALRERAEKAEKDLRKESDWARVLRDDQSLLIDDCWDLVKERNALRIQVERLREALREVRPLVEKWCHTQGNHPALFEQYLGPIDAALKAATEDRDDA